MFTKISIACFVGALLAAPVEAAWTNTLSPGDAYSIVIAPNGNVIVAGQHNDDFAWAAYDAAGTFLWECKSGWCDPPSPYMGWKGRAHKVKVDNVGRVVVAGYEEPTGENWASNFLILRQIGSGVNQYSEEALHEDVAGGRNEANDIAILPNNRAVVGGFMTVAAPTPHTEIYLSLIDSGGNEVGFLNLTGAYAIGDATAEAVAPLSDNSVIVAGKVWGTASDDKFYVTRVETTPSSMLQFAGWAPFTVGSTASDDSAYDVAIGKDQVGASEVFEDTIVVAGTRTNKFYVTRFGLAASTAVGDFPYESKPGVAYAVAVYPPWPRPTPGSIQDVVAAGKNNNDDLQVVKLGPVGAEKWVRTIEGARCEYRACDVTIDGARNVIVAGQKDGKVFVHTWDKDGNALGGPLGGNGTARAVTMGAGAVYAVASSDGMRATSYGGCAIEPNGPTDSRGALLLLPLLGFFLTRRRRIARAASYGSARGVRLHRQPARAAVRMSGRSSEPTPH